MKKVRNALKKSPMRLEELFKKVENLEGLYQFNPRVPESNDPAKLKELRPDKEKRTMSSVTWAKINDKIQSTDTTFFRLELRTLTKCDWFNDRVKANEVICLLDDFEFPCLIVSTSKDKKKPQNQFKNFSTTVWPYLFPCELDPNSYLYSSKTFEGLFFIFPIHLPPSPTDFVPQEATLSTVPDGDPNSRGRDSTPPAPRPETSMEVPGVKQTLTSRLDSNIITSKEKDLDKEDVSPPTDIHGFHSFVGKSPSLSTQYYYANAEVTAGEPTVDSTVNHTNAVVSAKDPRLFPTKDPFLHVDNPEEADRSFLDLAGPDLQNYIPPINQTESGLGYPQAACPSLIDSLSDCSSYPNPTSYPWMWGNGGE
jgi:hypothetical protein